MSQANYSSSTVSSPRSSRPVSPLLNYFLSYFYASLKIVFGLLLHPYQTVFSLVRQQFCRFLVAAPLLIFSFLTLFWRFFFRPLILYFFSATCPLMVVKTSVLFFCLFWQVALFYLFLKFSFVLKNHRSSKSPK